MADMNVLNAQARTIAEFVGNDQMVDCLKQGGITQASQDMGVERLKSIVNEAGMKAVGNTEKLAGGSGEFFWNMQNYQKQVMGAVVQLLDFLDHGGNKG